jgi:hypothetical protein
MMILYKMNSTPINKDPIIINLCKERDELKAKLQLLNRIIIHYTENRGKSDDDMIVSIALSQMKYLTYLDKIINDLDVMNKMFPHLQ